MDSLLVSMQKFGEPHDQLKKIGISMSFIKFTRGVSIIYPKI